MSDPDASVPAVVPVVVLAVPALVVPAPLVVPALVPSLPLPSEPLGAGWYVPFWKRSDELFANEVVNRAESLVEETLPLPSETLTVHCVPPTVMGSPCE